MANFVNLIFTAPIIRGSGARINENCSVELLGKIIYGDYRHGYRLPCLDPIAQQATVCVNDSLSFETLDSLRWRMLLCRLGTLHNTHNPRVTRRILLWWARILEPSCHPFVKCCNDILQEWLDGEGDSETIQAAVSTAREYIDHTTFDGRAIEALWLAFEMVEEKSVFTLLAITEATKALWKPLYVQKLSEEELMDRLEELFTVVAKIACDEGCAIADEQEAEYIAFTEALAEALLEKDK